MDRLVFPYAKCGKCKGECTFCWLVDIHSHKHFRIWCEPCNKLFQMSVSKEWKAEFNLHAYEFPRYFTQTERGLKKAIPKSTPVKPRPSANVELLRRIPYAQYLKTEHWKNLRSKMLKRAKYKCELCNDNRRLHVHHKTYERRGCEWKSDLIVLCEDCHAKFHDKLPEGD
jgi:hypothetical protein